MKTSTFRSCNINYYYCFDFHNKTLLSDGTTTGRESLGSIFRPITIKPVTYNESFSVITIVNFGFYIKVTTGTFKYNYSFIDYLNSHTKT